MLKFPITISTKNSGCNSDELQNYNITVAILTVIALRTAQTGNRHSSDTHSHMKYLVLDIKQLL